jgi:hypothetical protein
MRPSTCRSTALYPITWPFNLKLNLALLESCPSPIGLENYYSKIKHCPYLQHLQPLSHLICFFYVHIEDSRKTNASAFFFFFFFFFQKKKKIIQTRKVKWELLSSLCV